MTLLLVALDAPAGAETEPPDCREGLHVRVGQTVGRLSCRQDWVRSEAPDVSILGERIDIHGFLGSWDEGAIEGIDLPRFPQTLVIVVNLEVVSKSTMLQEYIDWRRSGGWDVIVGTEWHWDQPTGDDVDDRAARIRAWLREVYEDDGGGYLLLIGSPVSPWHGVPMRRTQPLGNSSPYSPWLMDQMSDVPTDHYYADVESDWDCDGDELFGEYIDDIGEGCADWGPEFITGRIPYYGNIDELDRILAATIAYEQAADKTYRDRAIFAGAFGGFRGQPSASGDGSVYGQDDDLAGFLYRTEADIPDYLGLTPIRLFEDAGIVTSNLTHEGSLDTANLLAEWIGGASTVSWGGHGSSNSSHRQVWNADVNQNELAESSEVSGPAFITSNDSLALESAPLAVVHMMSCLNGHAETPGNLGAALLARGAIATASASRVAVGAGGEEWEPMPELAEATTNSYYFTRLVQAGFPVGDALAFTRWGLPGLSWEAYQSSDNHLEFTGSAYSWLTKFEYNLYGDPTVSLERCDGKAKCDDGLPCNGVERCEGGYCVHDDPLVCDSETDDPCTTRACSNETGQCEEIPRIDGLPCDDGKWCTVDDFCFSGVCLSGDERVCPGAMVCNEAIASCALAPDDETGAGADDGCHAAGSPGGAREPGLLGLLFAALLP